VHIRLFKKQANPKVLPIQPNNGTDASIVATSFKDFAIKKQFIFHTGFDTVCVTHKKHAVIINYLPDKYLIIIKCLYLSNLV